MIGGIATGRRAANLASFNGGRQRLTTSRPSEGTSPAPIDTLFIFPHAGGSAAEYKPFARGFTMDAKRIAVQYPGRADRHDVQDISSISALADEIHPMLAPSMVGARVAFFGHSMGGLIAFDIARRVEQAGGRIEALFVSASPAPGTEDTSSSGAQTPSCSTWWRP